MLTHCAIVITKDRPDEIAAMLRSLRAQTRPPDHIIIVDATPAPASAEDGCTTSPPAPHPGHPSPSGRGDGGEGGSTSAEERFRTSASAPHPGHPSPSGRGDGGEGGRGDGGEGAPRLTILHTPPNISGQKNAALEVAQEDILSFFDDDAEIAPDYCATVLARFEADAGTAIAGIGGVETRPQLRPLPERLFRKAFLIQTGAGENRILLSGIPDVGAVPAQETAVQCCPSTAVSYRRSSVGDVRFDAHGMTGAALGLPTGRGFSEDLLFSIEVRRHGRLLLLPAARFHHEPSPRNRESTVITQALYIHSLRRLSRMLVRGPVARAARIWAIGGQGLLCVLQMLATRDTGYIRGWWRAMTAPIG